MRIKTKQFCRRVIAILCAVFMVSGAAVSEVGAITVRAEETMSGLFFDDAFGEDGSTAPYSEESGASSEEIRTEWDFENDTSLTGENGVSFQGKVETVAGLVVDATNGGWDSTVAADNGGLVQVSKGTIVKIPLQGQSMVAVVGSNADYMVDGKAAATFNQGVESFLCEGKDGAAVLEVTAEGFFLKSIKVTPVSVRGEKIIDVWDFGAKQESNTELYANNITPQAWLDKNIISDGTNVNKKGEFIGSDGTVIFGDLVLAFTKGDRLYSSAKELSGISYGSDSNATKTYEDGYQAAGGWYMGGTGGSNRRYVLINNVQVGDKIVAYIGNHSGSGGNTDTSFYFEYLGEDGEQMDVVDMQQKSYQKCVFIAEYAGTYKIWENNRCKPFFHRIIRVPGVTVRGTIDFGTYQGTGHTVKLINQETKQVTVAALDGSSFTVELAAGYTYTALLSGAAGYGFTDSSMTVVTTDAESVSGKNGVELVVEPKETITFSGKITGFAADYDISELAVTLAPPEDSYLDEVRLNIDGSLNFTALLDPNVKYTLSLSGVNDYEIVSPLSVQDGSNHTENIMVATKPVYAVTGSFLGLDSSAKVASLKFENVDDNYIYTAEVTGSGYSISLRDGAYLAVAEVLDHSTKTHVVVSGRAVNRDLLFVSTAKKDAIPWVSDIYVGYPEQEHNYTTMKEAMEACDLMEAPGVEERDETQRITVHIAPGTYREQIRVNAPYVSFVNDTEEEVLLTWYYGIGYKYYSVDETGYYNPENAYDKYEKNGDPEKWGLSVYVTSAATGFRAEGITFENSFNRYITEEELEDGVEGITKPARDADTDAQAKLWNERAAAIGIDADNSEFKNCSFLSSQDTLYTGGTKLHLYFKNCLIEGQSDYIYGDGNCVFDECELRWKGYSDTDKGYGGYITAASPSMAGTKGYLFQNCVITANDELTVTAGYLGRPWGKTATVTYMNTKLEREDLIEPTGWKEMSVEPEEAFYYEYNTTTMDGTPVDTSSRRGHVLTDEEAEMIKDIDYFEGWIPYFYKKEDLSDFALTSIGTKIYGDEAFTLSVTGLGDAAGEVTYTSSNPAVISISGDTATILKAGEAAITATKAADDKYEEATATVNVTVSRKPLSVTAESKANILIGSEMPKLTFQTDGLVNGDTFTDPVIQASVDNTNTAGTYDIVISGGTLTNAESYDVTYVNGKLIIVGTPDRIAGLSRYETSLQSADTLKELKGIDQFEAVVIAAGADFPDALAGSTLAAAKGAPILLAGKDLSSETKATLEYVAENVKPGGEIYILGGSSAVSVEAEELLKADGYQVTRIAGTNRYETNMQLLESLKVPGGRDIIIASGKNYPDSIAVSGIAGAMGMPIILTNDKLSEEALEKIKEIKPEHIYLIGGTSAVSEAVEEQVQGLGEVKRVAGTNRFLTSIEIAKAFGLQNAEAVVIAYGNNFPDGLTGSVIAAEANAPILLVSDGNYQDQAEFIKNSNIESFYILGGTGVISDDTIKALLGL